MMCPHATAILHGALIAMIPMIGVLVARLPGEVRATVVVLRQRAQAEGDICAMAEEIASDAWNRCPAPGTTGDAGRVEAVETTSTR